LFTDARAICQQFGAVTIAGDKAANLDLCLALMAFSSEVSFACHTYCDTGPRFKRWDPNPRRKDHQILPLRHAGDYRGEVKLWVRMTHEIHKQWPQSSIRRLYRVKVKVGFSPKGVPSPIGGWVEGCLIDGRPAGVHGRLTVNPRVSRRVRASLIARPH
jgi:hypothetical protein